MATGNIEGSLGAVPQSAAEALAQDPSEVSTYASSDPNFLGPEWYYTEGIWGLPTHTRRDGSRWSTRHLVEETSGTNQHPLTLQMNRKEVILVRGGFKSSQILMVSGIGAAEYLQGFDIPVVVDLPGVGRNFMGNEQLPIIDLVQGDPPADLGITVTVIKTDRAVYDERDIFFTHGHIALAKMHTQNTAGYVRLRSAGPLDTPDINFEPYEEGVDVDVGVIEDRIA
ncbi:hypothetical protein DL766_007787 [Monosporascus sp. MC13-8B]|nr:hypothetical protein DL763_008955 [Monosporascus cannonballus]RYP22063.1 hypothetical protein DL766_007787 [Monosporascus sp. MC13-8B]